MSNVLENAIKYTPEGGQIRLEMGVDAEHATIRVLDNGPGIAVAGRSHLRALLPRPPRRCWCRWRRVQLGPEVIRSHGRDLRSWQATRPSSP